MITVSSAAELQAAITSPGTLPGEVIQLTQGTYKGDFVQTVKGVSGNPIKLKPQKYKFTVIDGSYTTPSSPYTEFYDLEFMNSDTNRLDIDNGLYIDGAGAGFYGCYIHDIHGSGGGISLFGSGVGAIEECVILNNGYRWTDLSGHGHGVYTHNYAGGARSISRNIFHDGFSEYTIHIYSGGSNYLKDYTCEDNVISGDAVHTGGNLGLINYVYRNNIQYGDWIQQGAYAGSDVNTNGVISGNKFFGTIGEYSINKGTTPAWVNLTESDNVFYADAYPAAFTPQDASGYSLENAPGFISYIKPFTKSERWLGYVAIYNKRGRNKISVDFSSLLSRGRYRLRNTENMSETWEFSYKGHGHVGIPMTTWTHAARIGDSTPPSSFPYFGAFVIESKKQRIYDGHKREIKAYQQDGYDAL